MLAVRLRDPRELALALIVLTAPLEVFRTSVGAVNLSLFRLALGAGAAVIALDWLRRRERPELRARVPLAVVALAAAVAVGLALNPVNTGIGLRLLATLLIGAVAIVVVASLARAVSPRTAAILLVLACVLPLIGGSWQALAPRIGADPTLPLLTRLDVAEGLSVNRDAPAKIGELTARTKGTFGDPNHYAVFLVVALTCAAALVLRGGLRPDVRLAVGLLGLTILLGLLSSYSRTGWGATIVAAVALAGLLRSMGGRRLRLGRRGVIAVAGATLAFAAVLAPAAANFAERLNPSAEINTGSNETHRQTAEFAWEAFLEKPLLGIGSGGIGKALDQGPRTSGAHSSLLTVAGELGLLGLAALFAIVWAALTCAREALRRFDGPDRAALAALFAAYVAYLAANVVYDLFFDDFHWLLLGLLAAFAAAPRTAAAART